MTTVAKKRAQRSGSKKATEKRSAKPKPAATAPAVKPVAKPTAPAVKPVAKPTPPAVKPVAKPTAPAVKPVAKPTAPAAKPVAKPTPPAARQSAPARQAPPPPALIEQARYLREAIQRSKLTAPDPWGYTAKARGWVQRADQILARIESSVDAAGTRKTLETLQAEVEGDRDFQEARRLF